MSRYSLSDFWHMSRRWIMDCRSARRFSTEHASITLGVLMASCRDSGKEGRGQREEEREGRVMGSDL